MAAANETALSKDERLQITEDILNGHYSEIDEPYTADKILDVAGDVFDVESKSTIHRYMRELEESGRPITTEWVDGEKAYSLGFDTDYTDRSQLDREEQADFITGEITGYNTQVLNERHEDKEPLRVLMLSEAPIGKKYYNPDMMDGLAYELEQIREEEGDDYFDPDEFLAFFVGDPAAENPFFHSKLRGDAMMALAENPYEEAKEEWGELFEEELYVNLLQEQNLLPAGEIPEDEDEREEYLKEHAEELSERMQEELDKNAIANKITSIEENIEVTARELEKLNEATGTNIAWNVATGEETRKNHEYLKDIRVYDYTEEERESIEEIVNKIEPLEKALRSLADAIDGDAEEIQRYLEESENILDLEKGDLDQYEEYEEYELVLDRMETLNHEIRAKEKSINAMQLEQAIEQALGDRASQIFQKRYIEPDAQEVLDNLTFMELKESIHRIGNVKNIWKDKELGEVEYNGWTIHVSHNLNPSSDVPLKYGLEDGIDYYKNKTVDMADVFVQGHHNQWQYRHIPQGRGLESDFTSAIQLSTFADAELIEEHGEQEGLKDWYTERKAKGIHDATAVLLELDVEEDEDGQLHKVPRIRYWGGDYLEKIGRQVNGDADFIRDFTEKNPKHFEFSGDRHQSAPENMDNPSAHSLNELVEKEAKWQDEKRPDDRTIVELGDLIEGVEIFRGQGSEVSSYTERDRQYIKSLIEANLEDLVEEDLLEDAYGVFHDSDVNQMLSMDVGHQFKEVDEKLGAYYDYALENGAELYAFSGDHGNRSSAERYMEESTILELMMDRRHRGFKDPADIDDIDELFDPVENRQETQVHTFGGNKDAIAYVSFDDTNWEALLGHTPHGRGRSAIQRAINQPKDSDVRLVGFGNYHDGAVAHQDGTLYLTTPANAPTNGLTLKIGDGTRPRGIISDVVVDEDEAKDYGEIEFFLPEA